MLDELFDASKVIEIYLLRKRFFYKNSVIFAEKITLMKYLDPRADLTFKRVFGEHPDLVISLLNALLPLDASQQVKSVEYIPIELVPDSPLKKNSIVDVRCKDEKGRQFLVEMQMIWSEEFKQRVLFNASKAYVRQLDKHENYELLQPVYSLNLVNEVFEPELPDYYHQYSVANIDHPEKIIEGLHLIFVELPKFKPHSFSEKKMQVLWLRYLTEMGGASEVPQELLDNPEVKKAVDILEESSYTPAQLEGYDKFWDIVRTERTYYNSARRHGKEEGYKEGFDEGKQEGFDEGERKGLTKGAMEEKIKNAKAMKSLGIPLDSISKVTGMSEAEISAL